MIHWLSVIKGRSAGKRFRLVDGQGTIGRGPSNQVQLKDGEVSRIHCRYSLSGEQLELADLESVNGTQVNQQPIVARMLRPGDKIQVGGSVLQYDQADRGGLIGGNDDRTDIGDAPRIDSPRRGNPLGAEIIPGELDFASTEEESGQMIQVRSDLNFMYHASLATSRTANHDEMLDRVVDLIFEWVNADRCCILLRKEGDANDKEFEIKAFRNREHTSQKSDGDKLVVSQSIINYVTTYRVGILSSNANQDDRISSTESALAIGIREAICVPIRCRGDMMGLIYVDSLETTGNGERFNEDQLKLMIAIASQVAFAIENEANFHSMLKQERLATAGRTVATLSHHINNILQGVNGGSHLLNEGLAASDLAMAQTGWKIVSRNQAEVSKLVSDMLTVCKPYLPSPVQTNPTVVIEKVVEQMKLQLARHDIECDWKSEGQLATMTVDPQGLHRAVFNLIRACSARCEQDGTGRVSIRANTSEQDGLKVYVWHNGTPVDCDGPEDILLTSVDPADETLAQIELAVCRKIVLGHGGSVSSTAQSDQTSRFTIWLPLVATRPPV